MQRTKTHPKKKPVKKALKNFMAVRRINDNLYKVASERNPLEEYEVRRSLGVWSCDCPHFTYRCAGLNKDCKHISRVKETYPEVAEIPVSATVSSRLLAELL
jgi:hypothetical protein